MTLTDELTIAALVIGPVLAVIISLVIEDRRQVTARKNTTLRTLLIGRLNFADPAFQLAINTVPIDFAKDQAVLAAWEAYVAAVRVPRPANEAEERALKERWDAALAELLRSMLVSTGYRKRDAAQITRSGYVSQSSADQYQRQMEALIAVTRLADNTGRIATVNEAILANAQAAGAKSLNAPHSEV